MKKLFYSAVLAVTCVSFVACGNTSSNKSEQDTSAVEVVADTADADSTATRDNAEVFGAGVASSMSTSVSAAASYGGTIAKTRNRCSHSSCHCSGYWGYKHGNGTFEGKCSNRDGNGYTCQHDPQHHGLKKY